MFFFLFLIMNFSIFFIELSVLPSSTNAITINKLYGSGISYPGNDNKYFESYKDFFIKKLKKYNISNIYFIIPSFINEQDKSLKGILSKDCTKVSKKLNLIEVNIDSCF